MQNDKTLEVNYIIHKLSEQANVENQLEYKLNLGDKVRLIENKHTMKKTRYNVTPFYFIITDINGKSITISEANGCVKSVIRSRIISL
jgi:penicillin V acylase-like amidase (Ntn superfamily)